MIIIGSGYVQVDVAVDGFCRCVGRLLFLHVMGVTNTPLGSDGQSLCRFSTLAAASFVPFLS